MARNVAKLEVSLGGKFSSLEADKSAVKFSHQLRFHLDPIRISGSQYFAIDVMGHDLLLHY